jgi:hypothetical protein
MDFFTVGDIARRIMEEGNDFEAVRGQLRTLVTAGLLVPDEQNPGTGLHRQFSEREVIAAAVFIRLAKRYDVGTKIGPLVRRALNQAFKMLAARKSIEGRTPFLGIGMEGSGPNAKPWAVVDFSSDRRVLLPPNVDDAVIIDLNKIFDRVRIPIHLYIGRN